MADGASLKPLKINKLGYRILGVLARAPQSGYDIVKALVRFRPVNISQVYPILTEMEAAGLLSAQEVVQSGKPNKKIYRLMPQAEELLREWIKSPTAPPEPRDEFVAKLYSLWKLPAHERAALLHTRLAWLHSEVAYFSEQLEALQALHGAASADPENWQFCRHILMTRRVALYREDIQWCHDVLRALEPASPAPSN